jgi:hypothetical protein
MKREKLETMAAGKGHNQCQGAPIFEGMVAQWI